MKIIAIIPTCSFDRIPLLVQSIGSLQSGSYKDIHPVIVVDGDSKLQERVNEVLHNVSVIANKEREDWIFSVNRVFKEKEFDAEHYIFASDDLEFPQDCIKNAMEVMKQRFPDTFGLVTIAKKNRCPFGLIGRKLVEHFPKRRVFCPDYVHFCSDTELLQTIRKLDVFAYPPDRECRIVHHRDRGKTYSWAHQARNGDIKMRDKREKKGYLWGIDFNLVGRND